MEIRGRYMPFQVKQYSELFYVFSELHTRGGSEDDQDRSLPCLFYCWVPQHQPRSRDKQYFKGYLIPW